MVCRNISGVSIWTVLSLLIQIYYISLCKGSLPSIHSRIGRHVAWDCINPFQVQAWANIISFFTTIISSDITTQILFFLDTGLSVCTIPSSNSFFIGYYQQASLKTFPRAPQDLWWSSQKDFPLWPVLFHTLIGSGGAATAVWVDVMVSEIKSTPTSPNAIHCGLKQLVWRLLSSKNNLT